jgi:glycosyltransferase involved in cell wall biosynthesis
MLSLLFIARNARHKGLPDLLRAICLLDRADWELVVVGGVHPAEAEEVTSLLRQLERVRAEAPVANSRVPVLMRAADVVVVPSRYENFCNVALEAMASGRAILGAQCGGIPDLVTHGWNGLLFPPADSVSLAGCIASVLDCPQQARIFGERGRTTAPRYDWAVVAAETIHLLESLPRRTGINST